MVERQFYTTEELLALKGGCFVFDVESFVNYWLVGFKNIESSKIAFFESIDNDPVQSDWLQWMADNFCLVGFNSTAYDLIVMSIAAMGKSTVADLKQATSEIIEYGGKPFDVLKSCGAFLLKANHIDLFDVAPLSASLKTYAARLHCQTIQDLPFDPDAVLTREQIAIVRSYNFNDLDNTELLLRELAPHLDLRAALSLEFGKDLRSRSDAQLAQEIINTEIERITGKPPKRQDFTKLVGSIFCYVPPKYIQFQMSTYNDILREICEAQIEIGPSGHVICPKTIEGRAFVIDGRRYAIGMGGLHSQEKSQALVAGDRRILDRDVTGYYPNLILKNGFAPEHLGAAFLEALQNIVSKRYAAKKAGRKAEADGLKIASNGTFGKLSDPYSTLYSPRMMVQTTLTGQLSLLMAIEWLTLAGFVVVSANTDGIVTLCPQERYEEFCHIWRQWEILTQLETEETEYQAIYARDVNNYIVVKPDGSTKVKGVYSAVGSALNSPLSKNPQQLICVDAVIAHITDGAPLIETIAACQSIERFVIVQKVTGGAQKDGRYLGKTVRYYYATGVLGSIVYCKSGNKVPMSDSGKPLMTLPGSFPTDIDYARYVETATGILEDIGFQQKRGAQLTLGVD